MTLRRVFVANRGEIAVRIVRACRALGLRGRRRRLGRRPPTAPPRRLADRAICIGPAPATNSYLKSRRSPGRPRQPAAKRSTPATASSARMRAWRRSPRGAKLRSSGRRRRSISNSRRQNPRRRVGRCRGAARSRLDGELADVDAAAQRSPPADRVSRPASKPRAAGAARGMQVRPRRRPCGTHFPRRQTRPTPPSATRASISSSFIDRRPPRRGPDRRRQARRRPPPPASATARPAPGTRRSSRRPPRPSLHARAAGERSRDDAVAFARSDRRIRQPRGPYEFMVDAATGENNFFLPLQLPHPGRAPRHRGGHRPTTSSHEQIRIAAASR